MTPKNVSCCATTPLIVKENNKSMTAECVPTTTPMENSGGETPDHEFGDNLLYQLKANLTSFWGTNDTFLDHSLTNERD